MHDRANSLRRGDRNRAFMKILKDVEMTPDEFLKLVR